MQIVIDLSIRIKRRVAITFATTFASRLFGMQLVTTKGILLGQYTIGTAEMHRSKGIF